MNIDENAIDRLAEDLSLPADLRGNPEIRASLILMEQQRQTLIRAIQEAQRWPQGEPPVGEVIRFNRQWSGSEYTYVAHHAPNGKWYLTAGANSRQRPMDWEDLRKFIGSAKVERAAGWERLT